MNKETKYEFRKRIDEVHRPDVRSAAECRKDDETAIDEEWVIVSPETLTPGAAALDLQNYLQVSMGLSLPVRRESGRKTVVLEPLEEKGFFWNVEAERIVIRGNVRRGVHWLEDLMNLREAPYLKRGNGRREPLFSPRMVHSGWGLDQFPDRHLDAIAHAGFDTILLFVRGVDLTTHGILDFNDLIRRAGNYGLNVYFYSYLDSYKHPDEPDADEFFDRNYGRVFRECPGAKGLILVGESCIFPSKDVRTTGKRVDYSNTQNEGIADPRPMPGFFPCSDYPQWLEAVRKAVHRYAPDVDIVFWTYNWGNREEKARLDLIRSLPAGISLEVTFEMFEKRRYPNHTMISPDYSITFAGPGAYFVSEAEAAHERGLRLYSMTNTGGMTWDCGVIPYIPAPQQWFRRYEGMHEARRKWNLSGIMDSHHYGWFPSVVCECAKWSFWEPAPDMNELLRRIAVRDFGADAAEKAVAAWEKWSEAIRSYTPGFDDQAGPLRIGPAYPFIFHPVLYPHTEQKMSFPTTPQSSVGARWLHAFYQPEHVYGHTNCGRRIHEDVRIMSSAVDVWGQGVRLMEEALAAVPEKKRRGAELQAGVGRFFWHTLRTMTGIKKWWLLNKRLELESDFDRANALLDEMEMLIREEAENVRETLPLVDADSRLGWEPSMDYMADREHLEWKLRQLDNLLNKTLPAYRRTIALCPSIK